MDIRVNNHSLNVQVRELQQGVKLEQAAKILNKNKDGFDTIGFSVDGKDYLAIGQGLKDPDGIGVLRLNRKIADVVFFENESNTSFEGAKSALKSVGGKVVMGLGAAVGVLGGIGMMAACPWFELGVFATSVGFGVAVAGGAAAAGVATIGAVHGALKKGHEETVKELTK